MKIAKIKKTWAIVYALEMIKMKIVTEMKKSMMMLMKTKNMKKNMIVDNHMMKMIVHMRTRMTTRLIDIIAIVSVDHTDMIIIVTAMVMTATVITGILGAIMHICAQIPVGICLQH